MKIVPQSFEILYPVTDTEVKRELRMIELAGRTAYKSEDKITADSHKKFIASIVNRNHLAVIEFGNMVVKFITDRGITHEIVRHRLCSFLQESTRYCNYGSDKHDNQVTFIRPGDISEDEASPENRMWVSACIEAESKYLELLAKGKSPQCARGVLPNCTKTEIIVKANFREWRHIFQLRGVEKAAHPDMRRLMLPLYETVRKQIPEVFDLGDPQ